MGTALIRAVGVEKRAPRGPLLCIESSRIARIGLPISLIPIEADGVTSIDWIHNNPPLLGDIQQKAGINSPSSDFLDSMLIRYCRQHSLPDDWRENVHCFLKVPRQNES